MLFYALVIVAVWIPILGGLMWVRRQHEHEIAVLLMLILEFYMILRLIHDYCF